MTDLPAPLTPADCDLRGLDYMPFHGARLYDSDFNARASDAEFRAAMALWWAAWQQVPAASLPDDDVVLCKLADLGRDLKTFRKIKAAALHNFQKCNDGRLYHTFLAGEAAIAWEKRMVERIRKAKWRESKAKGESVPDAERGQDYTRDADGDGDKSGVSLSCPAPVDADVPADGTRRDGTGHNKKKTTQPTFMPRADFERVATVAGLPAAAWTDADQARLDGWLERGLTIEGDIVPAVQRWLSDPKHDGGTHTLARFDIPIADALARKALPPAPEKPKRQTVLRDGEGEAERRLRAKLKLSLGDTDAAVWINPCGFRLNGEAVHVSAPSRFVANRIDTEFAGAIARLAEDVAGRPLKVMISTAGDQA